MGRGQKFDVLLWGFKKLALFYGGSKILTIFQKTLHPIPRITKDLPFTTNSVTDNVKESGYSMDDTYDKAASASDLNIDIMIHFLLARCLMASS